MLAFISKYYLNACSFTWWVMSDKKSFAIYPKSTNYCLENLIPKGRDQAFCWSNPTSFHTFLPINQINPLRSQIRCHPQRYSWSITMRSDCHLKQCKSTILTIINQLLFVKPQPWPACSLVCSKSLNNLWEGMHVPLSWRINHLVKGFCKGLRPVHINKRE